MVTTTHDETRDQFSDIPTNSIPEFRQPRWNRRSVTFATPTPPERPRSTSRLGTHRLKRSATNFAQVLDDNGGSDGLRKIDIDYFENVVLDIFKDKRQHHSPVVFDFMLLHEINIHHLEHLLLAEQAWLYAAFNQDEQEWTTSHRAAQAPMRLDEIRSLLHKYSTALRDFEDMRRRVALDNASAAVAHSSWHAKLLHAEQSRGKPSTDRISPFRRLSNALIASTSTKDDPENLARRHTVIGDQTRPEGDEMSVNEKSPQGVPAPACRQLAGVEDWARERRQQELTQEQKRKAERAEWLREQLKRFSMAVFAVVSLIAPMLLMSLVNTLACSLATTSVATLLFAFLITYFTQISAHDISVVVAGYTAVLVVFVGVSDRSGGVSTVN